MSELHSVAPTEPIPRITEEWTDPTYHKNGEQIEYDKVYGIEVRTDGAEFQVGDVTYNYLGKTNHGYMEFTSKSADGAERTFLVYTSRSEGSDRVSQGLKQYEKDGKKHSRLMKGPELSPDSQYTQDTQLHPDFEVRADRLTEYKHLRELSVRETPLYDDEGAEWYLKDFEAQIKTFPLGDESLDRQLKDLPVSRQSVRDIQQITGFDPRTEPDMADKAYMIKITELNATLEASGVMPDFSQEPKWVQLTEHPVLGNMIRETFENTAGGLTYEWQMARDTSGRTWIERIRFSDAEPTVYGTDKQMVYSGLLTSKPIDYDAQADGLPQRYTHDMGNGYTDVAAFLKELTPIKEYNKYCMSRDKYYRFVSVA